MSGYAELACKGHNVACMHYHVHVDVRAIYNASLESVISLGSSGHGLVEFPAVQALA